MAWSSRFSFSTRLHLPVCSRFSHIALYPYSTGSYESTRMVNIKSPPTEIRKDIVVTLGCHAMNRTLRNDFPHFLFSTQLGGMLPIPYPLLSRYISHTSIHLLKVNVTAGALVTANTLGDRGYSVSAGYHCSPAIGLNASCD